jgi:hypothetical protein
MKMEQTECSKTSAYKIQTPGNYQEENIQQMYRFAVSLNSALDREWWLTLILLMWTTGWANSIPIYIQQDTTLHSLFISGNCWRVDGCGNCRLHRESITGTFNPWRVPTQTELSRPQRGMITVMIFMKSLSFMTLHFEAYCLNSMSKTTSFIQYIREENCAVCNQIIFSRHITPMSLLSCPWTWHMYRI